MIGISDSRKSDRLISLCAENCHGVHIIHIHRDYFCTYFVIAVKVISFSPENGKNMREYCSSMKELRHGCQQNVSQRWT